MNQSEISAPLVSIVIPTYNQASVLPLAIKSCLTQTYPKIEIVVSDDCSSDNTIEVMRQFESSDKVRFHHQGSNIGRVNNYRKLLYEYAAGEWVINLDGDDYYNDETFIARAVNALNSSPLKDSTVFIMSGKLVSDKVAGHDRHRPIIKKEFISLSGKEYFQHAYFKLGNFSHSAALYNRAKAISLPFYSFDSLNTDAHSFLRLSLLGNVILLGGTPLTWNIHGNNQSSMYGLSQDAPEWKAMVDVANFSKRFLSLEEVDQWLQKLKRREDSRRIKQKLSQFTKSELLTYILLKSKFDKIHLRVLIKKFVTPHRQ